MTIYAVADTVPEGCTYLTAGKEYEVIEDDGPCFWAQVDGCGGEFNASWEDCFHLDGGNWRRIERNDARTNETPVIPDWAYERAAQELNAEGAGWLTTDRGKSMTTVARLIAKHEQQPVDPDIAVVKAVFDAWSDAPFGDGMQAALAAYKAAKP